MISRPSTSQTWDPLALETKNGSPPTFRNARTGELTPPGMNRLASANSEELVIEQLSSTQQPLSFDKSNDFGKTETFFEVAHNERAFTSHLSRVAFHHR